MNEKLRKAVSGFPDNWGFRLVLIYCVMSATFAIVFTVFAFFKPASVPPAAVEINMEVSTPSKSILCPGELLSFSYLSTINQAPAVIEIVYSWWSVDNSTTAIFGDQELFSVRTSLEVMRKSVSIPVPQLPTGRYELRFGSAEVGTSPDAISVPFYVPENCPVVTPTP